MPLFVRIAGFSLVSTLLLLGSSVAFGQTASDDAVKREREALELAMAVDACDAGATAPLDATAKAPPVQMGELIPADFDVSKLKVLQGQCQQAWIGAPKEVRMQLQWLRVTVAIADDNVRIMLPQLRKLAEQGSAEAQYLIYRVSQRYPPAMESSMMEVSEEEAIGSLKKAAEQGHLDAMRELTYQYHFGGLVHRDLKEAVKWARRLESMPPQGIASTPYEDQARESMPLFIARVTLEEDGFSPVENRIAFKLVEADMNSSGKTAGESALVVAKSLRTGRGAAKDFARAREILEARAKVDQAAIPPLAEMLVRGEGGPEDGRRAYAMLSADEMKSSGYAQHVLAGILLGGKIVGYRPQEAIAALAASWDGEDAVKLAGLLVDYRPRLERPEVVIRVLQRLADNGDDVAAMALAKLKLSDNSQFEDEAGARLLLKSMADKGNREALWLYASTQYTHLGSTSYKPTRQPDGLSDAELIALIDEGIGKSEPEAFLLKSRFLRAGILYAQDDQEATQMLIQSARRDNVRALLLLGDAYDKGLGIKEDHKKRLDAWRRAAALGSLAAKKRITNGFTFDTFDRLMTLEEGVTWRIALYNNGYGRRFDGIGLGSDSVAEMEFMGLFMGRAMEGGTDAVAEAVMNAFVEAPAGLEDKNLVGLGKAFPEEIKVAIEKRLKRDGVYRGQAEGFWGPEVRKALADWVDMQRPMVQQASQEVQPVKQQVAEETADQLPAEMVDRVRSAVTIEAKAAKNNRQKRAAMAKINVLAQYGDIPARWALMNNYDEVDAVKQVVSAAEVTRYGIDIMVSKPDGVEKAEFEFIFNTTQIYQDGKSGEFGQSVIATIRDDVRLQDPLVLGSILKQFIFAPGACDAVLAAGKKVGIGDLGEDGCDDRSLGALVAYAKEKGPSGIDARNRKAAAKSIQALDEQASR